MKDRAFALGLGGNSGDVEKTFSSCLSRLSSHPLTVGIRISPLYSTSPWGGVGESPYLNGVVCGFWKGSDLELLKLCRNLEISAGSSVEKNSGDRALDLDILFLEGGVSTPEMVLPHPRMALRRFVLVPLADLWKLPVPGLGLTPDEMLERVIDSGSVIFHSMPDAL